MAAILDGERVSPGFPLGKRQDPFMPPPGQDRGGPRGRVKASASRIARCVPFGGARAAMQEGMLYDYLEH